MSNHLDEQGDLEPEVEIDYSKADRGKYAAQVREVSNVVRLDPDVEAVFRNSQSVNEALRALIKASKAMAPESR